jgi:uncharacterized repeat protein (TIGR01451 family)
MSTPPQVDLVVTKTASNSGTITAGAAAGADTVTYSMSVSNSGPAAATGVTLSDVTTIEPGVTVTEGTPSTGSFVGTNVVGDTISVATVNQKQSSSTTAVGQLSISTPTTMVGNWDIGGSGGSGGSGSTVRLVGNAGNGGEADGGGIATYDGYFTITSALIEANIAEGGNGGLIGAKGSGAGGNAFGGGIYYDYESMTLTDSSVIGNIAIAGLSYLGGGSGTASGGGIYLVSTSGFTDPGSTITGNSPNNMGP